MENDTALEEFLKALRISLNYISLYSKEHRAFGKSCEHLKATLDEILSAREYCEVGFSPDSLVIGEKVFAGRGLYKELAHTFHSRKIKSIRFSRGISQEELCSALAAISLPVKELIKNGGVNKTLDKGAMPHFSVEELDYSLFLKDGGEETEDVWSYLLKDAFEGGEEGEKYRKIDEFIETFETMLGKLRGSDLAGDEELCQNIFRLLGYVRSKDEGKYLRLLTLLTKRVIKDKIVFHDSRFDGFRKAISEMPTEELSSILWEEISSDEQFDSTSLELFSALVTEDKHEQIADTLVKNAGKDHSFLVDPRQRVRIKKLFSLPGGSSFVPEIYKKAIRVISQETYFDRGFVFDRHKLAENFDRILLNLLMQEQDPQGRESVIRAILRGWDAVIKRGDTGYVRAISELILRMPEENRAGYFGTLESQVFGYVEEGVFGQSFPPDLGDLVGKLQKSELGLTRYMHEFFVKSNPRPQALSLFFRLFPSSAEEFCAALAPRSGDLEFMSRLIDGLKTADSGYSLLALEKIYALTNELIQGEVLAAMAVMKQYDRQFLFTVLAGGDSFLKRGALLVMKRDANDLRRALDSLLRVANFWGQNNTILLENLAAVEELALVQAREPVSLLARRRSPFARAVTRRAKQIMEKPDVR